MAMYPTTAAVFWAGAAFGADLTADPSTWEWTDLTRRWLTSVPVDVKDGRSEGATQAEASECMFTLKNDDGALTPDDPRAEYAPDVIEGTPIWWIVNAGHGDYDLFQGFASSWTPRWPGRSKHQCLVDVEAHGIMQRLGRGQPTPLAPGRRAILRAEPAAFWPLDDGSDATQAASGLSGGTPMAIAYGEIDFAAQRGPLGNGSRPEFLDASGLPTGTLAAPVVYQGTGWWCVEGWVRAERSAPTLSPEQMNAWSWTVTGTAEFVRGVCNVVADDGLGDPQVNVYMFDASGGVATFGAILGDVQAVDGEWHYIGFKVSQATATTYDLELRADGEINSFAGITGTIGQVGQVAVPGPPVDGPVAAFASLSVSDLAVHATDTDMADRYAAGRGYAGETASDRIARIGAEIGIPVTVVAGDSAAMGPQPAATDLEIMRECERTDLGRLSEAGFGVLYRPGSTLYNQAVAFTLDAAVRELAEPFEPRRDTQGSRNEWQVSRTSGSSAVYADLEHQRRHGRLTDSATVNPELDSTLQHQARWRTRVTTTAGMRYPSLSTRLHRNPHLIPAWQALQLGDRIQATVTLPQHPQAPVDQLVEGRRQQLVGRRRWNVTLVGSPAAPYQVGVVQGAGGPTRPPWRAEIGDSFLAARLDAASTSAKIATSSGPELTTSAVHPADFPFRVAAGVEEIEVRAISTDTPAFIAAGTAAHGNNAAVSPGIPAGMTPDVGQLLVCWAAIRNSGTGTVDLLDGWYDIAAFGNCRLMADWYTGQAAPTVTFSGGVANATTSAQLYGFSGVSPFAEFVSTQLNGAAQDIATPAGLLGTRYNRRVNRLLLWAFWKADDWTSAAVLGGGFAAEAGEATSTLGDDQSIGLDFFMQASPAQSGTGTIAITGGASAISRAVLVGLRPLQTATIVRGMNGVARTHQAGSAVTLYNPPALAL